MRNKSDHELGVTLISLMVALTIATFVLAGLFDIWFQTRQTFRSQTQLAQLQDNERMALTIMANTVQTGGYYPYYLNYALPTPNPLYSSSAFLVTAPFTVIGQAIVGTYSATAPGDTITIRYIADPNTLDCQGQTETTGTVVVNSYKVASGNLQCSVDNGVTYQTIVSGVAQLSVLYAIDTVGDNSMLEYMNASAVTAAGDWATVRSADLQLTFINPLYSPSNPGQSANINMLSRIVAITQTTP